MNSTTMKEGEMERVRGKETQRQITNRERNKENVREESD